MKGYRDTIDSIPDFYRAALDEAVRDGVSSVDGPPGPGCVADLIADAFVAGAEAGIRAHAVWADGEQVAGAMRRPLRGVLRELRGEDVYRIRSTLRGVVAYCGAARRSGVQAAVRWYDRRLSDDLGRIVEAGGVVELLGPGGEMLVSSHRGEP